MAYIYKITNDINNKVYIGKTVKTIEERFNQHLKKAKDKVNRYLYDAMNCYGTEHFSISQIEECKEDIVDERERYWIAYYQSNNKEYGYNMTDGGEGGDTWSKNPHKEETSRKIREANLGKKRSPEFCKELGDKKRGVYYIQIDKDELLQDIYAGKSCKELEAKYQISHTQLYSRCKDYYGKTVEKLREDYKIAHPELFPVYDAERAKEELKQKRSERWAGEGNPNYKGIDDIDKLEEMLIEDKTAEEIGKYFNMSKPTLYKKIKEIYEMPMKEARKYVKSKQ